MIIQSDEITSPYDDVNKFLVFVPSLSIFGGSRISGLRAVIKLIQDDQIFVDFGIIMGALSTVKSDFFPSFVTKHWTCILAYPKFTSVPHMFVPYMLNTI